MIPKKKSPITDEVFQHATNISAEKTIKFARVKEILGGYTTSELIELLIDEAIKEYDDGIAPDPNGLPKKLKELLPAIEEEAANEE